MVTLHDIASAFAPSQKRGRAYRCTCPSCGSKTLDLEQGDKSPIIFKCWNCDNRADIWRHIRQILGDATTIQRDAIDDIDPSHVHERIERAHQFWDQSDDIETSCAIRYFHNRSIDLRWFPGINRILRVLKNAKKINDVWCPAIVAPMMNFSTEKPSECGVQLTFLTECGSYKADIAVARRTYGVALHAGVFFGGRIGTLPYVVGEGVESTLSAMVLAGNALNNGTPLHGVATLSANGMKNIVLPNDIRNVLIASDLDANETGQMAARHAYNRFLDEGRMVRVAYPTTGINTDFNDMLVAQSKKQ